jgi:protein kinase A
MSKRTASRREGRGDAGPTGESLGLGDFHKLGKLGEGAFGAVWLARSAVDGELYALKRQDKGRIAEVPGAALLAIDERNIMQKLAHPFIVQLYSSFDSSEDTYLVMTYAACGSLAALLAAQPGGRVAEPVARFFVCEAALALDHLRANRVVHRDLKVGAC